MNKVEYSNKTITRAKELQALLNSYYGKIGGIGTKCSKLAADSALNTGLIDIDDYPHDSLLARLVKTPMRVFANSVRKDKITEMLTLKRQAEMLFLDHCGVFSSAKNLLTDYKIEAADFRDVLDDGPDFINLSQFDTTENYLDELDRLRDKINAFIDRAQAATEKLIAQLKPISSASVTVENFHDTTVEDDGFAAQTA